MVFRVVIFCLGVIISSSFYSQTTDLLISEYVEGSSNNKYVEIYNGTGASVNLTNYVIRLYFNGNGTPGATINLSGTLANGNVYVVAHSSATIWGGTPDLSTGSLSFNGDDAIELYNTTTTSMVDLVGNIGCDPGSEWISGGNSTQNNTIVRNANVCSGVTSDPSTNCPFPTLAAEWVQFAQDDVSNLGSHSNSCGAPCVISSEPTLNSNSLSFSNIGCISMDLSWNSGNGSNRIVVASISPIIGTPSDQTLYTANSAFGLGNTISAGEFVVYNGSGNSFTVTGLSTSTRYYFAIFEYNGATPNCEENYLTTGFLTGYDTTVFCSCPEITGILVDACGGTIEGINEFFTFQNGNSSLPIDSLTATFPSGGSYCNSGCGAQNWTTNPTYVTQLNTTAGCPVLFKEADPIPANAEVIVFTGASPTYNFDFSGLCSTGPYYAIFANNSITTGRFANYNSVCTNRTLSVDFGSSCSDDATYSRCLLSNTDGDYVSFDASGTPTYQNDGCTPSAILPIELLNFKGITNNNSNILFWFTSTEINNDYFTVEKSMDAIYFIEIGTIQGAGNSNSVLEYQFIDDNLTEPVNYYRLKQTDFDGKYTYSNVIVLSNQSSSNIYFNNTSNLLEIGKIEGNVKIYNLQGQELMTFLTNNNKPINLSKGMYLITIDTDSQIITKKIIVQ